MRISKFLATLSATALIGGIAWAAPVTEGGKTYTVALSGASEVNAQGVPNQGDPDGSGTATLFINPGQKRVCYEITLNNVEGVTAAHIHEAPAGRNGPVVIGLFMNGGPLTGCADATSRQLAEIISKPSDYYVNVHSTSKPAGAVRGQLTR
jgi:hypothetical protein